MRANWMKALPYAPKLNRKNTFSKRKKKGKKQINISSYFIWWFLVISMGKKLNQAYITLKVQLTQHLSIIYFWITIIIIFIFVNRFWFWILIEPFIKTNGSSLWVIYIYIFVAPFKKRYTYCKFVYIKNQYETLH